MRFLRILLGQRTGRGLGVTHRPWNIFRGLRSYGRFWGIMRRFVDASTTVKLLDGTGAYTLSAAAAQATATTDERRTVCIQYNTQHTALHNKSLIILESCEEALMVTEISELESLLVCLDNKSDAVVNILDEILEDDLEDLGGEEAATKKGGRTRSQRFASQDPSGDSRAEDDSAPADMTRKNKRGGNVRQASARSTNNSGTAEPVTTRALRRKNTENSTGSEPANKKNAPAVTETESSPSGGKESVSNDVESPPVASGNETKEKTEQIEKNNQDIDESASKEEVNKEDSAGGIAQDDHYESGSDVSSSDEDEHSQISNPSFSSASFGSDSGTGTKGSRTLAVEKKASPNSGNEKQLKQQKKDYATRLNYILRDARFFLMKSNNGENVDLAKSKNVWATPPANETKINQALKEARNVLLIFSVKESGKFSGFARLAAESNRNGPSVNWVLPPGLSRAALGGIFTIDWISKNDVLFNKTQHLFNPWNEGKPVKIGRDGQEIEPHVASELCRLFPMDTSIDWNAILKRSKEAAKKVNHSKVISPIGSNSALGSRTGPRGPGYRDRRDTRGRFSYFRNGRNVYGRGVRRRFPDDDFGQRAKRNRGSYEYHYKGTYSDRGSDVNTNHRYSRERNYHSPRKVSESSHVYPDYVVRDYHHRPPPMAPLPYPPPPPFDSLPPPPRYYDGPPLPEFPSSTRTSSRDHRSASPVRYEKSVTEFLRRTSDRRERERERDRDRERKYRR
ncbi:unnamed protein product [Allacma fusca]|uniref:YTH domain-containing protein n=1 Tax=Allacma fusca TaxID=39272 RepID=A0A8J2P3Z2_9HEXA|nr:unnamed protein product [Allacma fusca]